MGNLTPRLRSTFARAFDKIRKGELRTLIPFLCMFRLNGHPMSLRYHYQFAPMFNTIQAPNTVWMCGRQLGKSYQMGADTNIRSSIIPCYHTLFVQPRADQIQRFNGTVYQPLMRSCLIGDSFISGLELSKLALKTYSNGSLVYLDHVFSSPDRVRGCSGICCTRLDEVQDIEYEFIPVITETMSASLNWFFTCYTGTPKTTDTTLALLWNRSSQAEWVIRCAHCGHFNVPNPEHDLLKMIGREGPVCARCGKPVHPRDGGYVHAVPERMNSFPGYHISQTVHPLHLSSQMKWSKLLDKVGSYTDLTLYNEVFGWPYDAATSPLTMADLKKATHRLPAVSSPADLEGLAGRYRYVTVAVDWSGGGMISDSYTSYAVLGLVDGSDTVEAIYGRRIPKGVSPTDEAAEIMEWIVASGADAFAYDNGGAGFARLEIMKQRGLLSVPGLAVVPFNYVAPRSGDVVRHHDSRRESDLYYYSLDKSRSLAVCIMSLKTGRILLPDFDETDESAFQRDFLALREDPRVSRGNETVILIIKKPGVPDDFAHAVNFGCSQIWDHFGAYPRLWSRYDTSALDYDEEGNRIATDEAFGPRGDFERFRESADMTAAAFSTGDIYD